MSPAEWEMVEQYLDASWPGQEIGEEAFAIYRTELGAADYAAVMRAVRSAALAGNPAFRPSALAIVARLSDEPLEIDDALRLFRRALSRGRDEGMEWLATESPAVALFVREVGWEQLRVERVDDPEYGGVVRARLATTLESCGRDAAVDPDRAQRLALSGGNRGLRKFAAAEIVEGLRPALGPGERAA